MFCNRQKKAVSLKGLKCVIKTLSRICTLIQRNNFTERVRIILIRVQFLDPKMFFLQVKMRKMKKPRSKLKLSIILKNKINTVGSLNFHH